MNLMLEADLYHRCRRWLDAGRGVAAAVVVNAWGSAPRRPGARLLVRDDGEFCGSVSGGCIEGAVITAAVEVIANRQAQTLSFGVADETAWEVGLSCGGEITVLVYPCDQTVAARMNAVLKANGDRRGSVLITRLRDGAQQLLPHDAALSSNSFPIAATAAAEHALTTRRLPHVWTDIDDSFLIEPMMPPPRLLMVGATHITQTLLPFAAAVGFECVVVDPRPAWATAARFPNTDLRVQWPDEALPTLHLGAWDAVVTLTHDPKIDDPALCTAITAAPPPFYIGALGSQRTHAKRLNRLQDAGITAAAHRIHAPVGLDIGALTPPEIALSIIAEVTGVYRRSRGQGAQ